MPTYHLSVKAGRKAAAGEHAKYIAREDHYAYISRGGKFEARGDLKMTESGNMPAWAAHDASLFWQAADTHERVNGRPYTEIEVSIPRELDDEQRVALVREFVEHTLGERHAYTWAIHNPAASDGLEQPHAHIMFTERVNDGIARDPEHYFRRWNAADPEKGGAGKDRYLSSRQFVRDVREEWAVTANHFMAQAGIEARIDHRSYRTLGIELEPSVKVGVARYAGERGVMASVLEENRQRAFRNGQRLLINPAIGVAALTIHQSTFSRRDVEQFVFRNTDGAEQFRQVYARLMNSKELLALSDSGRQGEWFTSTDLRAIELRLVERARTMSRTADGIAGDVVVRETVRAARKFNPGQEAAFVALAGRAQLVVVNGAAGTGKSYVLAAAREALEVDGSRVMGAALQGKTADDMQRDTGIASRTLHSLLSGIERGTVTLDPKTVLVVDEAGMVGSRQMEKLLGHAQEAGARVRLVGDAWQLHAVDAGDAFRAVSREAGAAGQLESLTGIMRQKEAWQREATSALARHDVQSAVSAYAERGGVQLFSTVAHAREQLIAKWQDDRRKVPGLSQLLLTHTNDERCALNARVRELRRIAGELGDEQTVPIVGTGDRHIAIAAGERIMFLQNEYVMQVKNGTLATVERIDAAGDRTAAGAVLQVRLDDGRQLAVNTAQYGHFDHGYALTIHKSQGVTVDRAYVLATKGMHAELAYVAMTRHKEKLVVAAGRDEFADGEALMRSLARADEKSFSAQHELRPERDRQPELGYRHTLNQRRVEYSNAPRPQRPEKTLNRTVRQYADALSAAVAATRAGRPVPAKDRAALKRTGAELDRADSAMRREIRHVVERDDRAWHALVELSGAARAAALVNEVRAARAQRSGINDEAAGLSQPTPGSGASRRFADMTPEERQDRRNEFKAQLREAAGQMVEPSSSLRERSESRGRGGPEIGK
ncbi:plasmid mobilization system relaxase [Paraburkholderia sp. BL6665CI2N2]|uniref:AAA family ATPase n=1 Tax=Paraburkholderia sp. BL6665CI2N2 TaxID=1938806 RepID=UPI001064EBEC|nr:AAA family ATPase [Paraburkholderia sp. BL6665CI2N2]TDY15790.1 plasmid mobilization system relaxase [Paraburkholderia sp. BL6665CI2N2]